MLKNQIDLIDQFMFKSAMDYDDKNYGKNNIKNT